jgi:formate--tetrahydrofolate ligase
MSNPVTLRPILDVAHDLGLDPADVIPWGRHKAKVSLDAFTRRPGPAKGRLVLVSAINPTPAGEGKTTTSIGLAMGLRAAVSTWRSACASRRSARCSA